MHQFPSEQAQRGIITTCVLSLQLNISITSKKTNVRYSVEKMIKSGPSAGPSPVSTWSRQGGRQHSAVCIWWRLVWNASRRNDSWFSSWTGVVRIISDRIHSYLISLSHACCALSSIQIYRNIRGNYYPDSRITWTHLITWLGWNTPAHTKTHLNILHLIGSSR